MTCQANVASDWLALAALKCFTEWVGLCAKEGSGHMAPNMPAHPWLYLRMYMLDVDASTDTTHVFTCSCLSVWSSCHVDQKKVSFCSLKNKTWVESHISAGMWIFCWIIFCFIYTYVDLFNAELKEYNEYKAVAEASNSFTNYCQAELHVVLQAMLAK